MAGIILKKAGAGIFMITRIFLYIVLFFIRVLGFLLKIFLLLFFLLLYIIFAITGISGKR